MAVNAMKRVDLDAGAIVTKQGDAGDEFFVMTSGKVEFFIGSAKVGEADGKKSFGELALVYNSPRNATIKCAQKCVLWKISRAVFRKALAEESTAKHLQHIKLLTEVPVLKCLSSNQINSIAGALKEATFRTSQIIIEQGDEGTKERGQKFYFISKGKVSVTQNGTHLTNLTKTDIFGERALMLREPRNATITAVTPVECLTLSAEDFRFMLGDNEQIIATNVVREKEDASGKVTTSKKADSTDLAKYDMMRCIGQGTFGRVKLAQDRETKVVVAVKCLQKVQIVQMKQVQNVLSEKEAMEAFDHPFVLKLLGKAQDKDQLYFILEICQGGELWSLLYQSRSLSRTPMGGFEESTARLYAAEVISGLGYIHKQGFMYRDLKPENLMIDKFGYLKIVDFGFCKKVPAPGKKSQTLCGTPEYLSPELVLQRGHNQCVDYWAFGCLVYELITNDTPFADPAQNRIFKKIVNSEKLMPHLFHNGFPVLAKKLIEKLLQPKPSLRLGMQSRGCQDIFDHKWFEGMSWQKLNERRYKAAYTPKITSDLDDTNFDVYDKDVPPQKYTDNQAIFKSF